MSLLDEIEVDARQSRAQRIVAATASQAVEELRAQRALPLLQRVESYLQRAAAALNDNEQIVSVSYTLPKLGDLNALQQANYRVSKDAQRDGTLRFQFDCAGARQVKGILPSEALAIAQEKALVSAGLRCKRVIHAGDRRALLVEPYVRVSLDFQRSDSGLKLRTRNFHAIENRSYELPPARVDEEFMEALLEAILRRSNRLPELTGNTVAETNRQQLRKELARQERRRRAEVSGALKRLTFPLTEIFRRLFLQQ